MADSIIVIAIPTTAVLALIGALVWRRKRDVVRRDH
jgi:hypothetical protein